jgi:hypothetical protein
MSGTWTSCGSGSQLTRTASAAARGSQAPLSSLTQPGQHLGRVELEEALVLAAGDLPGPQPHPDQQDQDRVVRLGQDPP